MGKMASGKAVEQLQQIYNQLGEFGGIIETKNPENWWSLSLQLNDDKTKCSVGVFSKLNGDYIYDPGFHLNIKLNDGTITEAEILDCVETTILGTTRVDGNDMISGFGIVEKDECGLEKRFSNFMNNMTVAGPYLSDPAKVTKRNGMDY